MNEVERRPRLMQVFRTQLKWQVFSKYAPAVILLPLIPFFWPEPHNLRYYGAIVPWQTQPLMIRALPTAIFTAVIAPALMFAGEGPHHRRYHWSLPVGRETHDLMRVLTGAIWLLAGVVMMAVVGTIAEPRVLREQWLFHAPVFYAGLILVPMLMYFLSSAFAIAFERPLIVIFILIAVLSMFGTTWVERHTPRPLYDAIAAIVSPDEQFSIFGALKFESAAPWHDSKEVERVFTATVNDVTARVKEVDPDAQVSQWRNSRTWVLPLRYRARAIRSWELALLLWYGIAAASVALALQRRPDV